MVCFLLRRSSSMKIILIEDESILRELYTKGLKILGHEIASYDCCRGMLRELETNDDFDAIISDYLLPDSDGLSCLQIVRDKGIEIPAILISGYPALDKIELEKMGCLFVGKPFSITALNNLLLELSSARYE